MREEIRIPARDGVSLGAWFYRGGDGRRPCVVVAHGFGATRRCGLDAIAERFQEAGLHALVFDYRGFGDSEGEPRQLISARGQQEDWDSAIAHARARDGVDPERIVLWGVSYSGGAVVIAAARDGRIAAVTSLVPMMDTRALTKELVAREGSWWLLKLTWKGVVDSLRGMLGMQALRIPIVGPPGSMAAITNPGADVSYRALAGPDWVDEVCARILLTGAGHRPVLHAARLPCPILVQIGDRDSVVPASAAQRAAELAGERATVIHYPFDHFEGLHGAGLDRILDDQLAFLRRTLQLPEPVAQATA